MNIGKVFKTERERLGISRPEMAKRLKMTASALWKIEAGKTVPKHATIENFCRNACVSLAYVYMSAMERNDFLTVIHGYVVRDTISEE